jgi:hypothetical protein
LNSAEIEQVQLPTGSRNDYNDQIAVCQSLIPRN